MNETTVRMKKRDWLLLGLSMIPAGLMAFGDMIESYMWIWTYTYVFHFLILLLAVFAAPERKKFTLANSFLIACDFALIVFGFLHQDLFLCMANCLAIPMLTAMSMLSLSDVLPGNPLSAENVWAAFSHSLDGLFRHIPVPFRRSANRDEDASDRLGIAVFSICLSAIILIFVALLLADADAVFFGWCESILTGIEDLFTGIEFVRILIMLIAGLMIFSWMFSLRQPGGKREPLPRPSFSAIFPCFLLPMLNALYALFVYIQFSNLFGGAETAAMTGGYAEYARSGFFQLVAVTFINLCILAGTKFCASNSWIRWMSALLILFTGVILVSAFWRMRLYILAYGLSILRVLTLWGMLLVAALLVIAAISLVKKNFPAFAVGLICLIVLWIGLNAANIDKIVAEYNVSHYLSGQLAEIDVDYLRSLSPDAQPAIDRLKAKIPSE